MTSTNRLIGQLPIVLAIAALGSWVAMLRNQPSLRTFYRAAYGQEEPALFASFFEAIVRLRGNDADVAL